MSERDARMNIHKGTSVLLPHSEHLVAWVFKGTSRSRHRFHIVWAIWLNSASKFFSVEWKPSHCCAGMSMAVLVYSGGINTYINLHCKYVQGIWVIMQPMFTEQPSTRLLLPWMAPNRVIVFSVKHRTVLRRKRCSITFASLWFHKMNKTITWPKHTSSRNENCRDRTSDSDFRRSVRKVLQSHEWC